MVMPSDIDPMIQGMLNMVVKAIELGLVFSVLID
jgi:hypothetical protein